MSAFSVDSLENDTTRYFPTKREEPSSRAFSEIKKNDSKTKGETQNQRNFQRPKIERKQMSVTYSELYRRKSGLHLRKHFGSPEGASLPICADSQHEVFEDTFNSTSENRSFFDDTLEQFQRLHIGSGTLPSDRYDSLSSRSSDFLRETQENQVSLSTLDYYKPSISENTLHKRITYRPYTIQDYRDFLSTSQLDRSLGPDYIGLQEKRECLMRRRSYGDSASAQNRQQILCHSQKLKERRVQKNILSSAQNEELDSQVEKSAGGVTSCSCFSEKLDAKNKLKSSKSRSKSCTGRLTKSSSSRTAKKFTLEEKVEDDSYLYGLQEQHLRERKIIDELLKRSLDY